MTAIEVDTTRLPLLLQELRLPAVSRLHARPGEFRECREEAYGGPSLLVGPSGDVLPDQG